MMNSSLNSAAGKFGFNRVENAPYHVNLKGTSTTKVTSKGSFPARTKVMTPASPSFGS